MQLDAGIWIYSSRWRDDFRTPIARHLNVYRSRLSGKKYREIAKEYGCTPSSARHMYNNMRMYRRLYLRDLFRVGEGRELARQKEVIAQQIAREEHIALIKSGNLYGS